MISAQSKTKGMLSRIFWILFFFSFLVILLNVFFNRRANSYVAAVLIPLSLTALVVIVAFYRLCKRYEGFLTNNSAIIASLATVFLLAVQLAMVSLLRFDPIYDLEAIYQNGILWATEGDFGAYASNTCHVDYFYFYPNNLGATAFLALLFKIASFVGMTDYFLVASIANALMIVGTMLLTSYCCRCLYGTAAAVTALFVFLISPPFYFMAPVFYTDSLSMIFPVATFALFLRSQKAVTPWGRWGFAVASVLVCGIGVLLKATVAIVAVAICLTLFLTRGIGRAAIYAGLTIVSIAALTLSFNALIYTNHLDREKADRLNTPIACWLCIGFGNGGRYDGSVVSLSRSVEDPGQRNEVMLEELSKRIDAMGLKVFNHFEEKSAVSFGDGTYALSDFLDDNPRKKGTLHTFLLYNSENYAVYSHLCTGVFAGMLLLMLASAILSKRDLSPLVPQLSVFGLMLFLLVWETNPRYITNYIPMILLCAVAGTDRISSLWERRSEWLTRPLLS